MKLWDKGKVFAICLEFNSTEFSEDYPLSSQIFKGTDQNNAKISNYKIFSDITNDIGDIVFYFDDLLDNREYIIFITVGNNLPYEPLLLYDDENVRTLRFTTPVNYNLLSEETSLEIVREYDP